MPVWTVDTGEETVEQMVESIAKAWFEAPCPPEDGPCNADLHDWEKGHPEDKDRARHNVRFVLKELGFE